jgi:hypothetical protein
VQKKILGDIREQKISQVYDEDAREEKVYRRPPTFLVIASKIVRPSTVYQVKFFTQFLQVIPCLGMNFYSGVQIILLGTIFIHI